jgi:phage terminase Nu1 subunit (DNA packaging protein)
MKVSTGRRVNRSQLAEIFGVAQTTVDAWSRRGCPVLKRPTGRGKGWLFDTADIAHWLREQAVKNALGDSESIDREEAEKRKAIATAQLRELEVAERRGELINVDLAVDVVQRDYAAVRARLLGLPAKMAPEVAVLTTPAEARSVLEREIHEILAELSDGDVGIASGRAPIHEDGENGEGGDPEAAADVDAQRMGRREPDAVPGGKRRGRPLANEPRGVSSRHPGRDERPTS